MSALAGGAKQASVATMPSRAPTAIPRFFHIFLVRSPQMRIISGRSKFTSRGWARRSTIVGWCLEDATTRGRREQQFFLSFPLLRITIAKLSAIFSRSDAPNRTRVFRAIYCIHRAALLLSRALKRGLHRRRKIREGFRLVPSHDHGALWHASGNSNRGRELRAANRRLFDRRLHADYERRRNEEIAGR